MNPANPQAPRPTQPIQDVAAPPPSAEALGMAPSVVQNIPMRTQAGAINEDTDLDKIMRDVGQDLKKVDDKPKKKGFFSRKSKPAPPPKPPISHHPMTQPQPAQPHGTAQPTPAPNPKTPAKPKSAAPVLVIFLTVIITGALIAAAVLAFRQSS